MVLKENIRKIIKTIISIIIILILLKGFVYIFIPNNILHLTEKATIINKYITFPKHTEYCIIVKTLGSDRLFEFPVNKQEYDRLNINSIINIAYTNVQFSYGESNGNVIITN